MANDEQTTGLIHRLVANEDERQQVERTVGRLRGVSEHLSDVVTALKDKKALFDAIAEASPFLYAVGEAAADAIGPVKFVATLLGKVTKRTDPADLGELACTLAYQAAVADAVPRVVRGVVDAERVKAFRGTIPSFLLPPKAYLAFSFDRFASHAFIEKADLALRGFADALYLSDDVREQLVRDVHGGFLTKLTVLLSDGKTAEKFKPWTDLIKLESGHVMFEALAQHAAYQRALFRNAPVLRVEPFALQHVYVDVQCGVLTWEQIRPVAERGRTTGPGDRPQTVDPFDPQHGGRQDVLGATLRLLGNPSFRDAVVIQGVAGAGKSSFTLRLCDVLSEKGLRPLRIRLRDVAGDDRHIREALASAIQYGPDGQRPVFGVGELDAAALNGNGPVFQEDATLGQAKIARCVLILDGWDEIQTGTTGFFQRMERLLAEVRAEYLSRQAGPPIRVILTGRPSSAIHESRFLRAKTAILTLRPLEPDALRQFVSGLCRSLARRPLGMSGTWQLEEARGLQVVDHYEREYRLAVQGRSREKLDVLGQPLLALMALKLVSAWPGGVDAMLAERTTLYRSLVDLTCRHSGQPHGSGAPEAEGTAKIEGLELRRLLQETAAAIFMQGGESISGKELKRRLEQLGLPLRKFSDRDTDPLAALMVSFFFHTGHEDLGNEFVHKSFGEFLHAEGIVEQLKHYARGRRGKDPLRERENYWEDFATGDPRYKISRDLAWRLAPHWLSPEVAGHIDALIQWEISRADEGNAEEAGLTRTESLDLTGWETIRTMLADLWDWWGEGVHLRPQPSREPGEPTQHKPSFANVLAGRFLNWDERGEPAAPERTTSVDGHFGEGLFHLAVCVHAALLPRKSMHSPRRYQHESRGLTRFSPSGGNSDYFVNYVARICAAGWRPMGPFPARAIVRQVGLVLTSLRYTRMEGANLAGANLESANLERANLERANLEGADLAGAILSGANLAGANLNGANLSAANLIGATLTGATLIGATLNGATLIGANLFIANLTGAKLYGANLEGSTFGKATRWPDGVDPLKAGARLVD